MTAADHEPLTSAELFARLPGWEGSDDDVFVEADDDDGPDHPLRSVLEWLAVVIGALAAALLIKVFLFQAFFIPSESMLPTLEVGDRVLVNKLAYSLGDVERGDVVVFHKPETLPVSDVNEFIKRVIGLPGDTVEGRDGIVYVNGQPLDEPYLPVGVATDNFSEVVGEGELFVMGDNRNNSQDSRSFGPIDAGTVVGEAFVRVWPVPHLGGI